MTEGYNGYTNYETWLAALHDVHEGQYEYIDTLIKEKKLWEELVYSSKANRKSILLTNNIDSRLTTYIEDVVNELEDIVIYHGSVFLRDMLNSALRRINYRELADAAIDSYLEENEDIWKEEEVTNLEYEIEEAIQDGFYDQAMGYLIEL